MVILGSGEIDTFQLFQNCTGLEEVTILDTVSKIYMYTFSGCTNLKKINYSNSITEIHSCAFENCTSLKEIRISRGVIRINEAAFNGCSSLEKVYIPSSVTNIGGFKTFSGMKSGSIIYVETEAVKNLLVDGNPASNYDSSLTTIVVDPSKF